jgi:hypothetical protein
MRYGPPYIWHSVLVVGLDFINNEDNWLIKNSFGPNWRVGGYMLCIKTVERHYFKKILSDRFRIDGFKQIPFSILYIKECLANILFQRNQK